MLNLDPNKIYYHGTNHKFDKFDKSKIRENKLGLCFNFTDDIGIAYQYGNNIMKVHLDLKNPLTLDLWQEVFPYEWFNRFAKLFCDDEDYEYDKADYEKHPYTYGKFFNTYGDKPEGVQVFEEMGYDGIALPEDGHYGVFEPEQIHIINDVNESEDNFKKWFGNSKVVDDNGNPLVVYHGSPKQFDTFKPVNYYDIVRPDIRPYTFFSDDKEFANAYGGNNYLYSCYLKIENPYVVDAKGKVWNNILESTILAECPADCDGIIIKNIAESRGQFGVANDYIVFNPNQIKSIDNNGEWSSSNNIYERLNEELLEVLGE